MVVENFDTFYQWLTPSADGPGALIYFLLMALAGSFLGLFCGYLVAAVQRGMGEGFYSVATTVAGAIPDFLRLSARRVLAIARLTIQESIRARVAVAFVVFLVVLLYARWFLDSDSDNPAKLYLLFIITSTFYLMMVTAVFLSTFSLPADIKSKTIYTVVTKPVRASEIILGRMLGFTVIGTVLLAAMAALVGYVFILRGLTHQHEIDTPIEVIEAEIEREGFWKGETSNVEGHRHQVTITADGEAFLSEVGKNHRHEVYKRDGKYVVSTPVDQLKARVPHYGRLRFLDKNGGEGKGISVGKEWTYRSYIEGETLAAGIWTFQDVRPERFHDELPLELNLSVFRTFKGDIVSGIEGTITLKNPDPAAPVRQSVPISFSAKEFETDHHYLPRKVQAVKGDGETVNDADIFEDLCDENGRLEIWIRCEESGQYFGMSQADLYILEAERPFAPNYIRGFLGIWMQMVMVICFGVAISTRVNAAIAMLGTICFVILAMFREQITGVFKGLWQNNPLLVNMFGTIQNDTQELVGGGPIESIIRLMTQKPLTGELDMHWLAEGLVKWCDVFLQTCLMTMAHFAPDLNQFNTASYLATGYNISYHVVAMQLATCGTYVLIFALIGYFFLKTREIAA